MTNAIPLTNVGAQAPPDQRPRVGALARLGLWLSVAVVTLVGVGLLIFAVIVLAHHAAPAGGGG